MTRDSQLKREAPRRATGSARRAKAAVPKEIALNLSWWNCPRESVQ
jgi:hypothetical protein